jgi:hypothetical protein
MNWLKKMFGEKYATGGIVKPNKSVKLGETGNTEYISNVSISLFHLEVAYKTQLSVITQSKRHKFEKGLAIADLAINYAKNVSRIINNKLINTDEVIVNIKE